jgi:hypothetical protein
MLSKDRDEPDTAPFEPKRRGRPPKQSLVSQYSPGFIEKVGEEIGKPANRVSDTELAAVLANWTREKGKVELERYVKRWS